MKTGVSENQYQLINSCHVYGAASGVTAMCQLKAGWYQRKSAGVAIQRSINGGYRRKLMA
jgi:hypothetical protein